MKTIYTESEAAAAIEAEMKQMIDGAVDPYEAGWRIWEIAFSHVTVSPQLMTPFWLMWGALTDWAEVKPRDAARAKEEMMRASREWFALEQGDEKARDTYFDRWIHDELGIARKEPNR